jgi:hypothetical protein
MAVVSFVVCRTQLHTHTHTQRGLNHSHMLCTVAVTTAATGATSNCAVQNIAVSTHLLILCNSAASEACTAASFGLLLFGSAVALRTGQELVPTVCIADNTVLTLSVDQSFMVSRCRVQNSKIQQTLSQSGLCKVDFGYLGPQCLVTFIKLCSSFTLPVSAFMGRLL